MSVRIQEIIHKFEVGAGTRLVRFALIGIIVIGLAVVYDSISFRNLSTEEAMDAAQVGRNLAEGKGFTTSFIRPFSLFLLTRNRANAESATAGTNTAVLPGDHPDLANAPLYPALLALVLKANPFGEPDLSKDQSFSIYLPDLWIGIFNQVLLLLSAAMVFGLAQRLFDASVAWVSSIGFLTTELIWRFSVSGLSTLLLILLVLVLAGIVVRIEMAARETPAVTTRLVRLSLAAGAVVGLAAMTRYSAACLIAPLLILLVTVSSSQRALLIIAAVAAFVVVIGPWTARNYYVSGTPFGSAGFAIMETTSHFPEHQLQRSLRPALGQVDPGEYWRKFTANFRDIVMNDLPKLGGNWLSALFLAGLLMPFRNPIIGRMRLFLILSILALAIAQALGRTTLSSDSPEINSENLLVIVAPIVFIYGVSLFFVLRDQLNLQGPVERGYVWAAFYAIIGAPLLLTLLAPHPSPVVYPPYYPPWIQQKARAVGEEQAIMTDIPWAVAWYGKRPSIWLSLKHTDTGAYREDFYSINELRKIHGLYLTGKSLKSMDIKALADWVRADSPDKEWENLRKLTTDLGQALIDDNAKPAHVERLRSIFSLVERNWVRGGGGDWESFVLGIFIKREVPTGFPLQRAVGGLIPEVFLAEAEGDRSRAR